jgi:hypothetical protein
VGIRPLVLAGALVASLSACSYTPSALEDWPDAASCGEWENRNEPVSGEQRRKTRCLLDAFESGRTAELYVVFHSVEGDPIREYYRVLGSGRVEVFIDSTADSFANQKWSHLLCGEVADEAGYVYVSECRELWVDRTVSRAG